MIVLRTARLTLRHFTAGDAAFIFRLLNELSFIENIGDKGVRSLEQAAGYLREGPLASYARHGFGLYAVALDDSDRLIGMCGLLKRDRLDAPDIGYAFLPEFWSNGFAIEAASAVLAYATQTLGHPRTLALVSPRNLRSIRLLRKLRFAAVPDADAGPDTILFELNHEADAPPAIIRVERPGEAREVYAVHAASFPTESEARLVDALRAAGRLKLSLVATDRDRIAGHVGFSPVTVAGAAEGVGLAPVAVIPEYRRRGIAARLVREGLAACRTSGCGFVVVFGEPRYYARFGFTPASRWGLHDEYGGGDAFQALELRPGAIPSDGGVVRYAPEFNAVESDQA